MESSMKQLLMLAVMLLLDCTAPQPPKPGKPPTLPISVRSYNRSEIDVYLLCGDHDAEWLGMLQAKDNRVFRIPASRARCGLGLNFFLVSRRYHRGYWVGPLYPTTDSSIDLIIEKYAGLSTAAIYID
jgi:hypothetical protein